MIYSISTLNENYSESVVFRLKKVTRCLIKTLTLETRSEVRMAIGDNPRSVYNIIVFGIEQYGLKIGLHSSCNSVRLHTETFQTQQNKVLEVWLTRFDPGVTR